MFYEKNFSKKQLIFEKWENFESGQKWPQCKGYRPWKILSFRQKIKLLKTCEKHVYKHIKVLLCKKNRSKKQLIFEKWEHFENCQKWSQCKGYSPCKMVSLVQKLKMLKWCEKLFYNSIRVVVCKKRLQKKASTRKMRRFWKLPKMAKMQRPMQNDLFGSKIKNAEKVRKTILQPH